MPLTHLPSLQHQHLAVLPPLRASHQLGHINQLNQLFPMQQQTQQYSPQNLHTVQQAQEIAVQLPPAPVATVDLTLTGPLRRGKWTRAEEDYAAATISYFCDGLLAIQYGTTLRGYLAQQLHCDPMRISKKLLPGSVFAGIKINPKIGRRAYYPCAQDSPAAARSKENAARHLTSLRQAFIQSIEEEEQALDAASNSAVKNSPKTSPQAHGLHWPQAQLRRHQQCRACSANIPGIRGAHGASDLLSLPEPGPAGTLQLEVLHGGKCCCRFNHSDHARMCKLPKLTVTDDVSRRASYSTQQRSVSPVTVATSTAVLPPLRVSLVRASMS
ncbi:hypothetical protein GQ600_20142 [Phytophthora cactorum]|nr:hypothetical protein GQ600_20142 [Phytophthora cactorum]